MEAWVETAASSTGCATFSASACASWAPASSEGSQARGGRNGGPRRVGVNGKRRGRVCREATQAREQAEYGTEKDGHGKVCAASALRAVWSL